MRKNFPIITFGMLSASVCFASTDLRLSETAAKRFEAVRSAVANELASPSAPVWAGEYAGGGIALSIAPKGGFAYERHGETRLFDRNVGSVGVRDGSLHLLCVYPNYRDAFHGVCPDLVPVAWGARTYLIPEDGMAAFCNSVNLGREPRTTAAGAHLLRVGDEAKEVSGKPGLPARYARYILPAPVEVEAVSMESEKLRTTTGTRYTLSFKSGTEKGLFVGMELVSKGGEAPLRVKLTKVSSGESFGDVLSLGDSAAPSAGMKFFSRE